MCSISRIEFSTPRFWLVGPGALCLIARTSAIETKRFGFGSRCKNGGGWLPGAFHSRCLGAFNQSFAASPTASKRRSSPSLLRDLRLCRLPGERDGFSAFARVTFSPVFVLPSPANRCDDFLLRLPSLPEPRST